METKRKLIDALVLHPNGKVTREKRWENITYYATDRHNELCNICKHTDYPECRKDCWKDVMWRKRYGVTL